MNDTQNYKIMEIPICDVKALLEEGVAIEVESADGYVPISAFVDKGEWEEYVLATDDGRIVRCNENHLFETDSGWISAKNLTGVEFNVLTDNGFTKATVYKTGKLIPIVDIQVEHENHRYYTNGVSSHNTGTGKSLFMCHHAANCLLQNKNVLYITCEMSEERIAERIDANVMDITMNDMKQLTKGLYAKKLHNATKGVSGQLIIKEYPTASAHVNHFRHLIDELNLKKKFKPDIIFIDYLNICTSSRVKASSSMSSYTVIKSIAEEIRGLAIEKNVPIFTATQVNRSGHNNTDIGLENTSESFGVPATADLLFALISTEELDQKNQIIVKQLKNRYNDITQNRKFVIGVNKAKMKLFNVDASEQDNLIGTGDEDDVGSAGHGEKIISKFKKKGNTNDWNI